MDIATKQARIVADIRENVLSGHWQPGHMLPSQPELMRQYDAALGTVRLAISKLQALGLVIAQRGRGTFVASQPVREQAAGERRRVGLITFTNPPSIGDHIKDRLVDIQQILEEHQIDLVIRAAAIDDQAAVEWSQSLDGAILWGDLSEELAGAICRHCPTVIIGHIGRGQCPPQVSHLTEDIEGAVEVGLHLLRQQGHQRIWLANRTGAAYYRMVSEIFRNSAQAMGIADDVDELVFRTPQEESQIAPWVSQDRHPSALLVLGGQFACRLIYRLNLAGIDVPHRLSVCAINGVLPHRLQYPELTRVDTPACELAVRATRALVNEMFRAQTVVRERLSSRLVLGNTCSLASSALVT
jgi:DNA-binding LacI/PurR family transcriptional regulator